MNDSIPAAKGFSIWLNFEKNDELILQNIIYDLASRFKSPIFTPHITLIKGLKESQSDLIELFKVFCENLHAFTVSIKNIEWENNFYKSFFILIDKNTSLETLFNKGIDLFSSGTNDVFDPHISLLYANISEVIKKKLRDEVFLRIPEKIRVNKISLVKTEGLPAEWQNIMSVLL